MSAQQHCQHGMLCTFRLLTTCPRVSSSCSAKASFCQGGDFNKTASPLTPIAETCPTDMTTVGKRSTSNRACGEQLLLILGGGEVVTSGCFHRQVALSISGPSAVAVDTHNGPTVHNSSCVSSRLDCDSLVGTLVWVLLMAL
jgi:hypothetical protein